MDTAVFNPATFAALGVGAGIGAAVALLVAAIRGFPAKPEQTEAARSAADVIKFLSTRAAVAIVVGTLVLAATRWPTAAIASGILVFFWNQLFGGLAAERAALARVEALASWTESLRDTIAGAVGLEQAIPATARAASPAIRENLHTLVDRLRARMPLPQALEYFADDMDDASADLVIAALILNSRLRGPGLREVLGALAQSSREEVDMRQRVMAQRSSTRRSVQIVVGVSVAVVLALAVFNKTFVQPYDSVTGQMVLLLVIGLFAAGFFWLRKLSSIQTPARFLQRARGSGVPPVRDGDPR
ncbi:type II secretion system F family protein [Catenulispora sp. NF23]|uniref:Type II secretion system F family protein n=1 Tax=Catenulispora pinistramenti TaxID=2705254 RepID=A0ABS5L1Y3_9ACTN|nr:type II secretion system F family protein [Catenulispora pinistramenti]MBS2535798.1 type II secretion system F family protein [Catenulispora pinistramenti]MBS2552265.1 type II secretion system F family protein [Catenulispora pinistramenti]